MFSKYKKQQSGSGLSLFNKSLNNDRAKELPISLPIKFKIDKISILKKWKLSSTDLGFLNSFI